MTKNEQLPNPIASLIQKLEALDLSDEEHRALGVLLGATHMSDPDEVAGFGWEEGVAAITVRGFDIGMPPTLRTGIPQGVSNEGPRH